MRGTRGDSSTLHPIDPSGILVGNPGDALLLAVDETGYLRLPVFLLGGQEGEDFSMPVVMVLELDESGDVVGARVCSSPRSQAPAPRTFPGT